jgi:hypothetical protein
MNHSYSLAWPEDERKPFTSKPIKVDPVLKKLESLHLVCVSHFWSTSVIPSESFPSLLSSPELVHLYIKDCVTLTDVILQKATLLHQFRNLEQIYVERFHIFAQEVGAKVLSCYFKLFFFCVCVF